MFCPKCGEKNLDGAKFCAACGASFGDRAAPASAPTPTASVSTQKPPLASIGERGSSERTCRSRFCVVFPATTTGTRAFRASARASRVTGQASASMNKVAMNPRIRNGGMRRYSNTRC